MDRFETRRLAAEKNLSALADVTIPCDNSAFGCWLAILRSDGAFHDYASLSKTPKRGTFPAKRSLPGEFGSKR
jgi:hypothetical protein